MSKLNNSLADMCVVVGMDADTGLKPVDDQPACDVRIQLDTLYTRAFDPQVLAAISGQVATFPQCGVIENLETEQVADTHQQTRTKTLKKGGNRRSSKARRLSVVQQLGVATTSSGQQAVGLPMSNDTINGLIPLCLPDGGFVLQSAGEDRIHSLVLTDIMGTKSYAVCLTYYRSFSVKKESDDSYTMSLESAHPSLLVDGSQRCYVPTCVVVMSKHPYFTVMKDCLSSLVPKLKENPEKLNELMKEFTQQITIVPIPPPGNLTISLKMNELPVIIRPPDEPGHPICDLYLHYPLLCFELDEVIEIITCILTQQRIVFISSDYSLLTPVMECFMMYILPFKWQYTYVPVLSYQLLDLIEAPGVFLMGCHSKYKERIEQIPGLIVANLDTGKVQKCPTLEIPVMPELPTEVFGFGYSRAKRHFDLALLGHPTALSMEEMCKMKQEFTLQCQQVLRNSCMELMVVLFGDVSDYLVIAQHHFKRKEFLDAQSELDRDFYTKVIKTEMFNQFLRDRLAQKRDHYAIMEEKMRPVLKDNRGVVIEQQAFLLSRKPSASHILRSRRQSLNFTESSSSFRSLYSNQLPVDNTVTFTLPPFQQYLHPGIFYERCIVDLNRSIEDVKLPNHRASYLYLRGMLHVACNRPISGIEDFHNLAAADLRIFPSDVVSKILSNLNEEDKTRLNEKSFYKRAEVWRKISGKKENGPRKKVTMEPENIPQRPVNLEDFIKHIQLLEIASDRDAISRLFYSLSLGKAQYVEPETFGMFYECWKESEIETNTVSIPDGELDGSECVLKVSSLIRTDHGTGRLILTQKRLFFLSDGKRKLKEVIRLRDIKQIEKIVFTHIFPPGVRALKITHKLESRSPYIASLKSERNTWYMLINEMWAGRAIADVQKDYQVIQQAAQNVLMIDAVIRSGESEETTHSSAVDLAAAHLCYYTKRRNEGMANLPIETTSALIHRVNPSNFDAEKATIEALLYTPGNRSEGDEDNSPKLWCGLGNGKIRVFDASTWICESQFIEAKDRVCCLMSVKGQQVWAGSFDTTIYIIDVASCTANKRLIDHTDFVSDMTKNQDQSIAYSTGLNGQIISWNTATLQKINMIDLQDVKTLIGIKWLAGNLWCCTKKDLRVLDSEGQILRKLEIPDGSGYPISMESFLVTPDNKLWTACSRKGQLVCWNAETFERIGTLEVNCNGFSQMVYTQEKIWAGSKDGSKGSKGGMIHIFNTVKCSHEKELVAHSAAVRSMCTAEDRYVMTGSEGRDGKIAIWRAKFLTQI
ncbi:DENN domain-containing protein 3-like isoform X2 [Ptychodera flava]|uniref:DENN domain-containing protein 3-like isoform X2 n=1 Tax=Ptychodera flava TaxID=63121 RepID=UPI003969F9A2